jgi:hypothetical protein
MSADDLVVAVVLGLAEAFDDRSPGLIPGLRRGLLEFASEGLGGGSLCPAAPPGAGEDLFCAGRLTAGGVFVAMGPPRLAAITSPSTPL